MLGTFIHVASTIHKEKKNSGTVVGAINIYYIELVLWMAFL